MLTIRRAVYKDISAIMKFIDEHWKKGNILARDKDFFEWQFVDGNKVNMFIAVDEENEKIYGMIGAIVYNGSEHPDISGCLWKTIKSGDPILGMKLLDCMYEQLRPRYACSAGLSEMAVKINALLGGEPIVMDHYYRLADREQYAIAEVKEKRIPSVEDTGYSLVRLTSVEEMQQIISEEELAVRIMSKDYTYIEKRYFNHPIYSYDIWKVTDGDKTPSAVLITREECVGESKIAKVVDYYGAFVHLGKITAALDRLMKEKEYEFVDVYSYGVPIEIYESAGFLCCNEEDENIIPNYFHPFVKENVALRMINPEVPGMCLFRGDGDQDRPS